MTPPPRIPGIEDLERIGQGGFATVYRGRQPAFNRHVAVKALDPSPGIGDRFEREVRAMGAVSDHPNVVAIYDAGIIDERPYLVMPILEGGTLEEEMRRAPLAPTEVVALGRAMADALAAAHAAGLLHRDVKPANILRTAYGVPQLADFGIARFTDAATTQGNVVATVVYAAPEVLDGKPATPASDVYSLGATLHAALTGHPPFESAPGEPAVTVGLRVLRQQPADLRGHGVPAPLAAVIAKAMSKDPAARHASAADLRDALDRLDLAAPAPETTATATFAPLTTTAAPRPPRSAPATPATERRVVTVAARRVPWSIVLAGSAVALAAVTLALVAMNREGPGSSVGTTAPNSVPGAVPTTAANQQSATTDGGASASGAVESAVRRYYATLDAGNIDGGFKMLSARYQNSTGRKSYEGFWRTVDSVSVRSVNASGTTARVTLEYVTNGGRRSVENAIITFVRSGDELLIDDYRLG